MHIYKCIHTYKHTYLHTCTHCHTHTYKYVRTSMESIDCSVFTIIVDLHGCVKIVWYHNFTRQIPNICKAHRVLVAIIASHCSFSIVNEVKTGLQSKHCFPSADFPKSPSLTISTHICTYMLQKWYRSNRETFSNETTPLNKTRCNEISVLFFQFQSRRPTAWLLGAAMLIYARVNTREVVTSQGSTHRSICKPDYQIIKLTDYDQRYSIDTTEKKRASNLVSCLFSRSRRRRRPCALCWRKCVSRVSLRWSIGTACCTWR